MRWLAWILGALAAVVALFVPVAPALGAGQAGVHAGLSHDLVVLRAGDGATAALVTLGAGGTHSTHRLPLGLLDHTGRALYTATPVAGDRTLVRAIDTATGRTVRALTLPGRYSTASGDVSATALSFDGRWLGLRAPFAAGTTSGVVIDTAAMKVVRAFHLTGRFGLDAIDGAGQVLYLIESLHTRVTSGDPYAYRVRSYQIAAGLLDAQPVLDKGEVSGTMSGVAWTRTWSPGGTWLFTLYVYQRPRGAGAFIHALLVSGNGRLAHCIDLPTIGGAADLAHYTLAVSPDGTSLYAVNPLLGFAAAMRGSLPYGTLDQTSLDVRAGNPVHTVAGSAVSADGATLYVATTRGIWVIDTASMTRWTTLLPGRDVASVVLSGDGRRLYALEAQQGILVALDSASAQVLATLPTDPQAWAIEQISS
jgi:hypothetical protein